MTPVHCGRPAVAFVAEGSRRARVPTRAAVLTGVDVSAPGSLVDHDRYPVLDLDGLAGPRVVARCRAGLAPRGWAEVPGVVTPAGAERLGAHDADPARTDHASMEGDGRTEPSTDPPGRWPTS